MDGTVGTEGLRVLFVGDAIVDEYVYVEALGKSPKEHLIATRHVGQERFEGGVKAAAAHLRTFVGEVEVLYGPQETLKRRFVDKTYVRKLFEVQYQYGGHHRTLEDISRFDVVVICDFGHGAITDGLKEKLEKEARFLVVNAQTNAANYGYNLITKYGRADLVVIDEPEARLAAGDRDSDIETVMRGFSGFKRVIVTHGAQGAYGLDQTGFWFEPAFTQKVVDTMGAGDAFLSVAAAYAAVGTPMRELLRIGNAAGALKTQIIGHRRSITKGELVEYLAANG